MKGNAGFFSAAASDEGAACPAYPWPQDGAQGGRKVYMQSDCAACHSMLPYAAIREAAPTEAEPKVAEIVVVHEQQPDTARPPLQSAAYTPLTTNMLEGLRRNNMYTAVELKKKMALPAPAWLQFLQPYTRAPHTA
ncbi:hypothetical protein PR202_ga03266 [Eleusine coracana subsp. coracana]|uniref:Cytochrome c domain-containing protein n=1 Tax=Eleusine coracana subsp. coracana TaxID=191504 RepID=A0AAV5BNL2_ELECO|nr:hypothetical protein QOZ80_2AG0150110 [Eleusine coracana subsp. coracana]GJM87325.1 hypothetical protein PR202_ga03266 [Eleusine coracana subsp. coracana]